MLVRLFSASAYARRISAYRMIGNTLSVRLELGELASQESSGWMYFFRTYPVTG